jgi:DNA invertase Pin-like site-specific DNA recombinase
MQIVAYLRVSTAKQGVSGLGLEAQRAAVMSYAAAGGHRLVAEFVEIESGKPWPRAGCTGRPW